MRCEIRAAPSRGKAFIARSTATKQFRRAAPAALDRFAPLPMAAGRIASLSLRKDQAPLAGTSVPNTRSQKIAVIA